MTDWYPSGIGLTDLLMPSFSPIRRAAYCKKVTSAGASVEDGHMITVIRPQLRPRPRTNPGERSKFVDQMRLIVVARRQRGIAPVHRLSQRQPHHPLEPPHPAVHLRRHPHLLPEHLDKPPRAQPGVLDHVRH